VPTKVLPVPNGGRAIPDVRLSDHSPFWDQSYDALMVTDTSLMRNPHYHQMTDTVEKLDLPFFCGVNAVKVFWQDQWIGYLPKDMAALVAAEVPEAAIGLDAVVTGLTTTSRRDAFRLQISIPIPKASRRLRALGVTSAFAWDFDRTSGADKLRLVVNCTETAFREVQELLAASYDVSECGYSYYPSQDGRHYPWYLSLTDSTGKAPEDLTKVEQLIRSLFGVPSESSRVRERQDRLKELEDKQEDINKRLDTSRAEERRLRREYDFNKAAWELRTEKAQAQGEQAIELAENVEGELQQELDLKDQELQLALAENHSLEDQLEQITTELDALKLQVEFLEQVGPGGSINDQGYTPWRGTDDEANTAELNARLLSSLRGLAGSERLKPRQCLELVSDQLYPGNLLVLDSAWSSAEQAKGLSIAANYFSCSGLWPPNSASRSWPVLQIWWQAVSLESTAMHHVNHRQSNAMLRPRESVLSLTMARLRRCGSTSRSALRILKTGPCAFISVGTATLARW